MLNFSTAMSHPVRLATHYYAHSPPTNAMSLPFITMPTSYTPPPKKTLSKPRTASSLPAKKVRSSKSNIPGTSRYWTPSEHRLFVDALLKYGPKDLKSIAAHVGTRNMIQCRTHEQKCFMRLMREAQRETELRAVAAEDASQTTDRGSGGASSSPSAPHPRERKQAKEVYSVPSSCGITLLSVVGDELSRAMS